MAKLARFVLISILLFGLFPIPVQAQQGSQGNNFIYIPLITQLKPDIPLEVQAEQVFNRLQPQLLEAKQKGQILNFEPDLSGGLVKIELPAGASTLTFNENLPTFADIHSAAQVIAEQKKQLAAQFLTDINSRTTTDARFYLYLGSNCFDAYSPTGNPYAHLVATVRDSSGNLISALESDADVNGYIFNCFTGPGLKSGYKSNFRWYNSTGTFLSMYAITVPQIIFTDLDNAKSISRGTAPAGKSFSAYWFHVLLDPANSYLHLQKDGLIPGTGVWAVDFGVIPFRGGDNIVFTINYTNFFVSRSFDIPVGRCKTGIDYSCSFTGFPGSAVSASIKHAAVTYKFAGNFESDGQFFATPATPDGSPILLSAGDTVTATGIATWILPNITATINYTTDVVSGKAPASKYMQVTIMSVHTNSPYSAWVHTDAKGNYSTSFASSIDLISNDIYKIWVYYVNPSTGNITNYSKFIGP